MKTTHSRLLCLGLIGVAVSLVGIMALTTPAGAIPPPPPQMYDLNMTVTPTGGGHVAPNPNPAGGTFDGTPNSWVETYVSGTSVALSAVPRVGHIFDHWEGDLTGIANYTYLGMNSTKNVTAVFCPVSAGPPPGITLTHATLAPAADGTTPCSRLTVGAGEIVRVIIHSFVDEDLKCGEAVLDGLETEGRWEIRKYGTLVGAEDTDDPYIDVSLNEVGNYEITYYARDSHNGRGTSDDPENVSAADCSTWSASARVEFGVEPPSSASVAAVVSSGLGAYWVVAPWATATYIAVYDTVQNRLAPTNVSFDRCEMREVFVPSGVLTLGPFPDNSYVTTTGQGISDVSASNTYLDVLNDGTWVKNKLIQNGIPVAWSGTVPNSGASWRVEWRVLHNTYAGSYSLLTHASLTTSFTSAGVGTHSGYLSGGGFLGQGPWRPQ